MTSLGDALAEERRLQRRPRGRQVGALVEARLERLLRVAPRRLGLLEIDL
jgi:hypothetical protein